MDKKMEGEFVAFASSSIPTLEKKEWNPKDDNRLIEMVSSNDYSSWEDIAKHFIQKTGTECFFHYEELRKEFDFLPISKFELLNGSIPLRKEVFPQTIDNNPSVEEKLKENVSQIKKKVRKKGFKKWTLQQNQKIKKLISSNKFRTWKEIAVHFPGKTGLDCKVHYLYALKLNNPFPPISLKNKWTKEEENNLLQMAKSQKFSRADFREEFSNRSEAACFSRYTVLRKIDPSLPSHLYRNINSWSELDDKKLILLIGLGSFYSWKSIAEQFKDKSPYKCSKRYKELQAKNSFLPNLPKKRYELGDSVNWTQAETIQFFRVVLFSDRMTWEEIAKTFNRSVQSCVNRYNYLRKRNPIIPARNKRSWTEDEIQKLKELVASNFYHSWKAVSECFDNKAATACKRQYAILKKNEPALPNLAGEQWTNEEDQWLKDMVERQQYTWDEITQNFPLKTKKNCMNRYTYLRKKNPTLPAYKLNSKEWNNEQDEKLIIKVLKKKYSSWEAIAKTFPDKSAILCKERYEKLREKNPFLQPFLE